MLSDTDTTIISLTEVTIVPMNPLSSVSSLSLGCWCQAIHACRLSLRMSATSNTTHCLAPLAKRVYSPEHGQSRPPGVLAQLMGKRKCLVASFYPLLPLHMSSSFHPRTSCPVRKEAKLFMGMRYTVCWTKKSLFYFFFLLGSSCNIHWMKHNQEILAE